MARYDDILELEPRLDGAGLRMILQSSMEGRAERAAPAAQGQESA